MTIILDGDRRTTIDRRPVTIAVTGLPRGVFRVDVLDGDLLAPGVIRPQPGVVVLTRVERKLTLRLVPEYAAEFPAGAVLTVRITTEATYESAGDDVLVQAVDVSGRPRRDVLFIDVVDGQRLSVTANKVIRDEQLGELANAARAAARAHLRDEVPSPRNVLVAVDMSASMAAPLAWRSVDAVIDIVAGIAQVIGYDRELATCLLTDHAHPVPASRPRDLAAATRLAIEGVGQGCGFRSAPSDLPVHPASVTYVVTDAVPGDVAALRAAHAPDDLRHLVLVADGGEPEPPEATGLPITRVSPPRGRVDVGRQLLDYQPELLSVVASLLTGARS
jgi:hypothetical protein